MLLRIGELAVPPTAYTAAVVDWSLIRQHFKAERKRRRLTQTRVAEKGGLDQSAISKMEGDVTYTPQVDTFTKAVEGLGASVSSFFAELERSQNTSLKSAPLPTDNPPQVVLPPEGADHVDEAVIERASDKLAAALIAYVRRLAHGDEPAATPRRPATRRSPRVRKGRRKGA